MNPIEQYSVSPNPLTESFAKSPVVLPSDVAISQSKLELDLDERLLIDAYRLLRRAHERGRIPRFEQVIFISIADVFRQLVTWCDQIAEDDEVKIPERELHATRTASLAGPPAAPFPQQRSRCASGG